MTLLITPGDIILVLVFPIVLLVGVWFGYRVRGTIDKRREKKRLKAAGIIG